MTPFHDLQDYLALPRLTGLRLSPDGSWLALTVSALAPDGRTFKSSIWRIDTGSAGPARAPARLTWSAEGEDSPAFLPDGGMLFLSARPVPDPKPAADAADDPGGKRALWLLPAAGGEARRVAAPPGGLSRLATATGSGLAAFTAPVLPGASGAAADEQQRRARADAGVTAILHESPLVRYWDHDLGPDEPRLLVTDLLAVQAAWSGPGGPAGSAAGAAAAPRDLTPQAGRALDEHAFELSPDGRLAVTGWSADDGAGGLRKDLVVIDTSSGERRTLLSAPGFDFTAPRIAPDGKRVVAIRERHETYQSAAALTVVQVPLDAVSQESLSPRDGSAGHGAGRWPRGSLGPAPRAGALSRGTGLGLGWLGGLHHHRGSRPRPGTAG